MPEAALAESIGTANLFEVVTVVLLGVMLSARRTGGMAKNDPSNWVHLLTHAKIGQSLSRRCN